jgi:AraC-like DNA-binding protein
MSPHSPNQLRGVERQALTLIHELRHQTRVGKLPKAFERPEHLVHYVISRYHGHVRLRTSKLARELGVTMRTLQRSFRKTFRTSMRDFQIETRLKFARYLLSSNPDLKMSVVAMELGYNDPNVFERFFHEHAGNSPYAWSEAERARRLAADRDASS